MKMHDLKEMTISEIENIDGGSLLIAIGVCYALGFATGAAILLYR